MFMQQQQMMMQMMMMSTMSQNNSQHNSNQPMVRKRTGVNSFNPAQPDQPSDVGSVNQSMADNSYHNRVASQRASQNGSYRVGSQRGSQRGDNDSFAQDVLPKLNSNDPSHMRNSNQGGSLFNPPNPNATLNAFNSAGVNIQASLEEAPAVELAPQLNKKKKKVKKARNFNAAQTSDYQSLPSSIQPPVEHSALQSVEASIVHNNPNDSINPQDHMVPLDFDPNSSQNVVHGDDRPSHM